MQAIFGHTTLRIIVFAVPLIIMAVIASGCLQNAPQSTTAGSPAAASAGGMEIIRTQYSPGDIPRLIAEAEQAANASLNVIAAIPPEQRTVDNTLLAFDTAISD